MTSRPTLAPALRGGIGAWLAAIVLAGPTVAESLVCADPIFTATGDDPATLARVCRVASEARTGLAGCGITLDQPVRIDVTSTIESTFNHCLAVYHCGSGRIELLTPEATSAARDRDGAFAHVSDEAYWDSLIVHELAHAASDRIPCPFDACPATSEFISYAMQVKLLPDAERARFAEGMTITDAPARSRVNSNILYFSPDHFAANAWEHFRTREDPCGYVARVVAGEITFDFRAP